MQDLVVFHTGITVKRDLQVPSGLTVYLRCGPAIVTAFLETVLEIYVNCAHRVSIMCPEKDIDSR